MFIYQLVHSMFLDSLYKLYNFIKPMVTTKIRSDFTTSIVNSLLFFSMQNTTEMYLSEEIKDKSKTADGRARSFKDTIPKSIDKIIWGLFRKNTKNNKSLDNEIERAVCSMKDPEQENVNRLFTKEEKSGNLLEMEGYNSKKKTTTNLIKSALKDLYGTFVSYAKNTYSAVTSSAKKIVAGPVRVTMLKLIRVFEYILTALNPQWNKVPGSPQDLDTLAPAITNHITINKENFQYETGYAALMYRP